MLDLKRGFEKRKFICSVKSQRNWFTCIVYSLLIVSVASFSKMDFFPISKLLENPGLQHLLIDILSCLDNKSLVKCRQVTKSWRDCIDRTRVLLMTQLDYLKAMTRHQVLLGKFQDWRDVFDLIKASNVGQLHEILNILKMSCKDVIKQDRAFLCR